MVETADIVDLVNENDEVVGRGLRSHCHGNPALIHRAVHVLVINIDGDLLLQLRAISKDIQPGKWDTSVGGHLDSGEDFHSAAVREMAEELGIVDLPLTRLYASKIRNPIESENIVTFLCRFDGEINFAVDEIEDVRFWAGSEIEAALGSGCFTPNFEEEWGLFKSWIRQRMAIGGESIGRPERNLFERLQQFYPHE